MKKVKVESESWSHKAHGQSQRAVQCSDYYAYSESADTANTESVDTAALGEHLQDCKNWALSSLHAEKWKLEY